MRYLLQNVFHYLKGKRDLKQRDIHLIVSMDIMIILLLKNVLDDVSVLDEHVMDLLSSHILLRLVIQN